MMVNYTVTLLAATVRPGPAMNTDEDHLRLQLDGREIEVREDRFDAELLAELGKRQAAPRGAALATASQRRRCVL